VKVDSESSGTQFRLRINSLSDLTKNEKQILRWLEDMPNGSNRFVAHPLRCLHDLGVDLAEEVIRELKRLEPNLNNLSSVGYEALKTSDQKQSVRFHLKGLFRRQP